MNETLHAGTADCKLTVTAIRSTPNVLQLRYKIHNQSSLPLFICNLFWKSQLEASTKQEKISIQPNAAHVDMLGECVSVGLIVVDVPISDGVKIFMIPYLTRVEPNQEYEANLELALPLSPYSRLTYITQEGAPSSKELKFEMGYFIGTAQVEKYLSKANVSQVDAYTIESFAAKDQFIISVGPFHNLVQVGVPQTLWD